MDEDLKRLKQLQAEKKWSDEELAEKLGLSLAMLSLIELGEMVPSPGISEKITEILLDNLA